MAQRNLQFVGRVMSGEEMFDLDIRDLDLCATGQGVQLYASTGLNGGVSGYALSQSGARLLSTRDHHAGSLASGQATVLAQGGRLIAAGSEITGVTGYEINTTGSLDGGRALSLSGLEAPVEQVAATQLASGQDLLVALDRTGALTSWRVTDSGAEPTPAFPRSPIHTEAQALAISDTGILLVADARLGGLASYRIDPISGALTGGDTLGTAEGLPVAGPGVLETITAHGQTWAVLGAGQSGSLTVVSVAADGSLAMADHLSDTLATRFGQIAALDVVQVNGRVLVLAGGGDGGLSLLELLPDGRLLHRAALENGVGQDLAAISALAAVQIGDSLEIYAASQDGAGLARLRYDLTSFAPAGQHGSAGDDLLLGAARLDGGAGEDVLIATAAGAELTGGAGADVFVATAQAAPGRDVIRILDFTVAEDQIDMSAFTSLRSLSGITTRGRGDGIELICDDTRILVQSHNGRSLSLDDIWPAGLGSPHRWQLGLREDDGVQYGGSSDDRISGGDGDEVLDGQGGGDRLDGGAGDDQLRGGDGDDRLLGGAGRDTLDGGFDADHLEGGSGNDHLLGGLGDDRLEGGSGADRLEGGAGNDLLKGGAGNDRLLGGSGQDHLKGQGGNDILKDTSGDATLRGGGGDDRLLSGAGQDRLLGGRGDDVLVGRGGDDLLKGGGNDDVLRAGQGDDRLDGGRGADRINAGGGADHITGGRGDDVLRGGGGADVFVFSRAHGEDKIRDFRPELDQIDLSALRVTYEALDISRAGRLTVVDTGAGEIRLSGLHPDQIDADDFLF